MAALGDRGSNAGTGRKILKTCGMKLCFTNQAKKIRATARGNSLQARAQALSSFSFSHLFASDFNLFPPSHLLFLFLSLSLPLFFSPFSPLFLSQLSRSSLNDSFPRLSARLKSSRSVPSYTAYHFFLCVCKAWQRTLLLILSDVTVKTTLVS